jgi:hypothetical protein
MTETTLPPGGIVFAKCTRITQLDESGNIIPGTSVFVTDQLMKATLTQVNEAGDTGAIKNAAGNLGVWYLRGDIQKWYTVDIEMVYPDPQIEALLTGGTLFSDAAVALGAPSGAPTVTLEAAGGTLPAGKYDYAYANYSVFGRTPIGPDQTVVVASGTTNQNVVSGFTFAAGGLGVVVYGRYLGTLQKVGTVPNIGSQATSAASGTGTVTSLTVTALTDLVPAGTTFQITGDTNTAKIVFTVTETGAIGAVSLAVSAPSVTTTIAAAALIPVFVDTGAVKPAGVPNETDLSAGPGIGVGQQTPTPGVVGNPNGVSLEFFMERFTEGHQDPVNPYTWFALPLCTYFVVGARDVTNAELQALYNGVAFPNPNWGGGPSGQFPFDSTEILQWTACGEDVVPTPSYVAQAAG